MGTDIHLFVEYQNGDGTWRAAKSPAPTYPWGLDFKERDPKWCSWSTYASDAEDYEDPSEVPTVRRWYNSRNYDVFAILADVRNGRGFAGCVTGDGFNFIAAPRGAPKDMSPEVAQSKSWDHTPSWLLLSEILAFDWDQVSRHSGVIPLHDADEIHKTEWSVSYEVWRETRGRPRSYSGGVSGRGIAVVDEREAIRILEGRPSSSHRVDDPMYGQRPFIRATEVERYYVSVSWEESYRESASDFLEFCQQVQELNLSSPDRVRFVFGFDS